MIRSRIALAAGIAALAAIASSAALADDGMTNTFGNTVVTTDSTGASAKIYFNADKTFTQDVTTKDGKAMTVAGTWETKDDGKTVCLTYAAPAGQPAPPPSCTPLQTHAVGEPWSVTNNQGQTFNVVIKPGR